MSKLISIITINYNNKTGLQKTIDSVVKQTYTDFEYVIIDGDSNDGSKKVIETYKNKFTYCVSEPDKGIYHAMNKGILAAKGNYLLFLNSGDELHDDFVLENFVQNLDNRYQIYYGDGLYIEENEQIKRSYPDKLSFYFFLYQGLLHQSCFIARNLFTQIFMYNEGYKIMSDWEFFICAICKESVLYKHLDFVVCKYDTTGISSVSDNHKLMHNERQEILKRHFSLFIDDYAFVNELKTKRAKQFLFIKNHTTAWKLLKGFMNLLLAFLPKTNKND